MSAVKSYNVSKLLLFRLFKWLIVIGTFGFLYLKLNSAEDRTKLFMILKQPKDVRFIGYMIVLFYLSYFNVLLEGLKWRRLLLRVEIIPLNKLFKSLLAGMTTALFTPARIGEFAGRTVCLSPANRVRGSLAFFIGAFYQMMVTVLLGLLSCLWFSHKVLHLSKWITALCCIGFVLSIFIVGLSIFKNDKLYVLLEKLSFLKRFQDDFQIFMQYTARDLTAVFGLSAVRYIVFSFQYFLLINLFVPQASYGLSLLTISLIYFFQSMVPVSALTDIGVRGTISVVCFGWILGTGFEPQIIAAGFAIWLVNILLPALIGLFFVLRIKYNVFYNNS